MSKKKFNETKVGKFLSQVAPKLLNTVGGVLPDSGALGVLRNIITEAPTVDIGWYAGYELDSIAGVLSLIVGAYFGSRGIEKVMGNNRHK